MLAALVFAVALQDPQVVDGVIARPQWVVTPTAEQLIPEGVGERTGYDPHGRVQLRCVVRDDGGLDGCRITAIPVDYPELGLTAFAAARHFRHAERLEDGRAAAGMPVLLNLRWDLAD